MSNRRFASIILAAGKGTRMKSDLPKGLFRVCGLPMVEIVARAMSGAGSERNVIVVGHGGDQVISTLGDPYDYAWQTEQLGTGHAAMMASESLNGFEGAVVISAADTPLLDAQTISTLVDHHFATGAECTVATINMPNPTGYGRILRDVHNRAMQIVEEKDATPKVKSIHEVNSGLYCVSAKLLFEILPTLGNSNAQGEYYLTDVVSRIYQSGGLVETHVFSAEILMGVNDRWHLAEAANLLRQRVLKQHCLNGVTILDPVTTYVDLDVEIGSDTVIFPLTQILGNTKIGSGCEIGPSTLISKSSIGDDCTILMSHINKSQIHDCVRVGPFANLRPGSVLHDRVKVGNFVEVKNAELGEKTSVSHLTYIGDSTVGSGTNVGAGTITCNYDGYAKYRTVIGNDSFIGSNSTLIAPVTIGDGVIIAAGSVITKDVPSDAMAVGRSRQEVKEEWARKWRNRKQTE